MDWLTDKKFLVGLAVGVIAGPWIASKVRMLSSRVSTVATGS